MSTPDFAVMTPAQILAWLRITRAALQTKASAEAGYLAGRRYRNIHTATDARMGQEQFLLKELDAFLGYLIESGEAQLTGEDLP